MDIIHFLQWCLQEENKGIPLLLAEKPVGKSFLYTFQADKTVYMQGVVIIALKNLGQSRLNWRH